MSRLGINIRKKRGIRIIIYSFYLFILFILINYYLLHYIIFIDDPEGCESPFVSSNQLLNSSNGNLLHKIFPENKSSINIDSSSGAPLPEYVKNRVLVRLRSQSEKDKIQKDSTSQQLIESKPVEPQVKLQLQPQLQEQEQVEAQSKSNIIVSDMYSKLDSRNSFKSENKSENDDKDNNYNQNHNQNHHQNIGSLSQSESKSSVNIVENQKENENVPYFLTESPSGTSIRLPPLDPHLPKLRGNQKVENPIRSKSNRKKKENEDHIII